MVIDLRTCVVIGGRGFIGRSLVLRLLKLDDRIVRIADSAQSLRLDPSETNSLLPQALSTGRASYFHVDVRNKPQIINAIEGSSVVFFVEAGTSSTHDFYGCYTLIVQGAKNVINACRECKVKRLIYNSSADVVFDGSYDIHNGDESLLYAWKFEDMLTDLKAQAEALFLLANDIDGLLTCALRPSNVFGPGDTEIIPFLVNQAKFGWAKFIIGSGNNMSDFTYVENVAHALICADEALDSRMVSVSGKAFFITNLEPVKFWEFVSRILEDLGYQRPMIKLPATLVWYTVLLVKWMHAKMASTKLNGSAPLHGVVRLALRTSTFNCSAAQKHIGYSPVVSLEMAFLSSLNQIASIEWESMSGEFMPEFFKLVLGTLSLPINFPGTNYHRGFQARKNIVSMLRRLVEERRACQETKHDMLGLLMNGGEENRYNLTDEEIIDQMTAILYSGYETVSTTSMMAIKYLHDHPNVLQELRKEHLVIRERKRAEDPINWNDFKS